VARQKQSVSGETEHYEVRCPGCNVSFPVGTKSCLHCGQRTALPGQGPLPTLRGDGYDPNALPDFEAEPLEPVLLEEAEGRTRSPFRLGMSGIWILLALVGSAYRVCSGG
jgi:hypothetical protein